MGLDPTSGLFAGEGHIPLACAASPTQAAPISGAVEKAEVLFDFDMSVTRVKEPARVTKPYTPEQWDEIEKLGDAVDRVLTLHDVRLTMGGEPTFISIDDRSGAEWHTAAVGPTKRALADTLIRRLRERFAPGGMLHYGQGKWYPGESLPRWAFALYWRADGEPLWKSADRIATEKANTNPTVADAKALILAVAEKLGLEGSYAVPAYEDFWHHLSQERALAANVDPTDSKLEDPELRAPSGAGVRARTDPRGRLRAAGGNGHDALAVGTLDHPQRQPVPAAGRQRHRIPPAFELAALCARRNSAASCRRLIPSRRCRHSPNGHYPAMGEPLETGGQAYTNGYSNGLLDGEVRPEPFRPAAAAMATATTTEITNLAVEPAVRTALSVEPRDGRLCVFMPPTPSAGDYFKLLGHVEEAAEALGVAVHIEGYPPPYDAGVNVIKVTPDPGVIEVNIQPARDLARTDRDYPRGV